MKNLIIIALTILIVLLGAFLPELLLRGNSAPEVRMDYQQVRITSQSSSDYAWRMERISEQYYGDGIDLLMTYISEVEPSEEGSDIHTQFMNELGRLVKAGAVPSQVEELLTDNLKYRIRYFYLFDNETVSGFRIAEMVVSDKSWNVTLCMDVESGKLAKIQYGGSPLLQGQNSYPEGFTSWYDVLRGYADYLGLKSQLTGKPAQSKQTGEDSARRYYESVTADKWLARVDTGSSAWMELRVLREKTQVSISVFDGGR